MKRFEAFIDEAGRYLGLFLNICVSCLDWFAKKLGPNGYIFYGVSSNIVFFSASMVLKLYPQYDWSICFIVRGFTTFLFSQTLGSIYKKQLTFPGNELKFVTIRNMLISSQQLLFYYVMTAIPLKVTWIVNNMGPIFIFVLSFFILKTKLSSSDILYLLVSLIGINIITAPQLIINFFCSILPFFNSGTVVEGEMNQYQLVLTLIYLISMSLWSLGTVIVTFAKTATSLSVNSSLGMHFIIIGSFAYMIRADTVQLPSLGDLLFIFICLGVPTFISQMLFIHGTLITPDQGRYSLTNYIPVFLSYGYQVFFENRSPNLLELFGVFLTFYGLFKVVIRPKAVPQVQQQVTQQNHLEPISEVSIGNEEASNGKVSMSKYIPYKSSIMEHNDHEFEHRASILNEHILAEHDQAEEEGKLSLNNENSETPHNIEKTNITPKIE